MKIKFLLINGSRERYWLNMLKGALGSLGSLQITSEEETMDLVLQEDYGIIIVDASVIKNVSSLISRIRRQQPGAKIVVVTASPTWRRAKAAFRAGANDYLPKSMNTEEFRSAFENILGF